MCQLHFVFNNVNIPVTMSLPYEVSDPYIIHPCILNYIKVNFNTFMDMTPTVSDLNDILSTAEFDKHSMSYPFSIFGPWKLVWQYLSHICTKNMPIHVGVLDDLDGKCEYIAFSINCMSLDIIPIHDISSLTSFFWISIDQSCYQTFCTQMYLVFGPPKNFSLNCFRQCVPHTSTSLTLITIERIVDIEHWLEL